MSEKKPCHKCKHYDHGASRDPKQRCKDRGGTPILKPEVFNGCEKFVPRPRFQDEFPVEGNSHLH